MTFWRPSRPSPAMLVALLALCVALGGTAIATTTSNGGDPAAAAAKKKRKLVPKNTVNSASVINNSLKLTDFKKAERGKLKGDQGAQGIQGIQGPPGTPDGYTKADADGKFLGKGDKAADSEQLDGKDSTEFIQGDGSQTFRQGVFNDAFTDGTFLTVPGIGHLGFTCSAAMSLTFVNDSADPVQFITNTMVDAQSNLSLASNELAASGGSFPTNMGGGPTQVVAQFRRFHSVVLGVSNQDTATVIVSADRSAPGDAANSCRVMAEVIHGHAAINLISELP
jgi:hypothetical protein